MSTIAMKAELVSEKMVKGTVCPLCGFPKTRDRNTCNDCRNHHGGGSQAANAVKATVAGLQAAEKVREELKDRTSYFPQPVLAQLRLGKGSEVKDLPGGKKSIRDTRGASGGFMEIWAFGPDISENLFGQTVTGLVELKRNAAGKFYLRVEIVPGAKSNVKLAVQPGQGEGNVIENLPSRWCAWSIKDKDMDATVGYLPA